MLESDEDLRARLLYVAGDGRYLTELIHILSGEALNTFAQNYGLSRHLGTLPPPFSF